MMGTTLSTQTPLLRRRVTVDGHGRLHPAQGEPIDVIADQLYAVVVLWDPDDGASWVGWLTTTTHRSVCFGASDLEGDAFQYWLRALPGWDGTQLWHATTCPGLHLVWRRRSTTEIPTL